MTNSSGWRATLVAGLLIVCSSAVIAAPLDDVQALIEQGQNAKALKAVDKHLREKPADAEARFLRGIVLVKLDRANDAIDVFAGLTRDYPQLPEPYNNLAVLYAQQGEYEKARDALEAALATHPSYATAHENLGDIYAALASVAYNRALVLDKGNDQLRIKLNLMSQLSDSPTPAVMTAAAPVAAASAGTVATAPAAPATAADVTSSIYAWAQAWSRQDVESYLASYSSEFRPEAGSRRAWARSRRERVSKPNSINVQISAPDVRIAGDRAVTTFEQRYASDNYSDVVRKTLELRNESDGWKIIRERSAQ